MSCPSCGHTMSNLGMDQVARRVFWCPRCGTIRTQSDSFDEHQAPFLVERARALMQDPSHARTLAVLESVGLYKPNI